MPQPSIKTTKANQVVKSHRTAPEDDSVVALCGEEDFAERRRKERAMNDDVLSTAAVCEDKSFIAKGSKGWRSLAAMIKQQQIARGCSEER